MRRINEAIKEVLGAAIATDLKDPRIGFVTVTEVDTSPDLRAAMEGLLEPEEVEESVGQAEVKQTFKASRVGTIAGCLVTDGKVTRNANTRLVRDGTIIWTGRVGSLRRFKDDVAEVEEGLECGIVLEDFADIKEGDVIELFETKQIEKTLE